MRERDTDAVDVGSIEDAAVVGIALAAELGDKAFQLVSAGPRRGDQLEPGLLSDRRGVRRAGAAGAENRYAMPHRVLAGSSAVKPDARSASRMRLQSSSAT